MEGWQGEGYGGVSLTLYDPLFGQYQEGMRWNINKLIRNWLDILLDYYTLVCFFSLHFHHSTNQSACNDVNNSRKSACDYIQNQTKSTENQDVQHVLRKQVKPNGPSTKQAQNQSFNSAY